MHLPLATLIAILSASVFALPTTNTTDSHMKGLPYGNFTTSNQTSPTSTDPSHSHNISELDDPHYRYEHHIASKYTGEDSNALLRRNNYFGDIASYSDGICTILVGKKTKLEDSKCKRFQPDINAAFIGINWGSGRPVATLKMDPFTDDDCKVGIDNGTIVTPHEGGMMPPPSAGKCIAYQEWLDKGGHWKSVFGV